MGSLIMWLASGVPQVPGTRYQVTLRQDATDAHLVIGWDDVGASTVRRRGQALVGRSDSPPDRNPEEWVREQVIELLAAGWYVGAAQITAPKTPSIAVMFGGWNSGACAPPPEPETDGRKTNGHHY